MTLVKIDVNAYNYLRLLFTPVDDSFYSLQCAKKTRCDQNACKDQSWRHSCAPHCYYACGALLVQLVIVRIYECVHKSRYRATSYKTFLLHLKNKDTIQILESSHLFHYTQFQIFFNLHCVECSEIRLLTPLNKIEKCLLFCQRCLSNNYSMS